MSSLSKYSEQNSLIVIFTLTILETDGDNYFWWQSTESENRIKDIGFILCDLAVPWLLLVVWTPIQSQWHFRNPQRKAQKANQWNWENCGVKVSSNNQEPYMKKHVQKTNKHLLR